MSVQYPPFRVRERVRHFCPLIILCFGQLRESRRTSVQDRDRLDFTVSIRLPLAYSDSRFLTLTLGSKPGEKKLHVRRVGRGQDPPDHPPKSVTAWTARHLHPPQRFSLYYTSLYRVLSFLLLVRGLFWQSLYYTHICHDWIIVYAKS